MVVPKKGGNMRITVNHQRLNRVNFVGKIRVSRIDEAFGFPGKKTFDTFGLAYDFFIVLFTLKNSHS